MAQRTLTILSSDLSDVEIEEGKGRTIVFGVEAGQYEIDLTDKEIDGLYKALDPYLSNGRKLARSGKPFTKTTVPATRTDLDEVRAWAKENGFKVSDRGRVAKKVLDAYDAR